LAKSQETQKRFSNEITYLTNQVDELSSTLLKSKMKIGELEATNESLAMRLNEISQTSLAEDIRQRVHGLLTLSLTVCSDSQIHREIKDKEDARALLDRTLAHLETLTSTNSTLQNQISKQVRLF
jgi:hypothetical protein